MPKNNTKVTNSPSMLSGETDGNHNCGAYLKLR
jgi:hypothetical protein